MTGSVLLVCRIVHVSATVLLFGTLLVRAGVLAPALAALPQRFVPERGRAGVRDPLLPVVALAAPVSLVPWIFFQAADMASLDPWSPAAVGATLLVVPTMLADTWFGHVQLIRGACLLLAALALLAARSVPGRGRVLYALLASGAAVALLASAGHLGAEAGSLWPVLLGGVHLLAAAAWLGGLPALVLFLKHATPRAAAAVSRRFSPLGGTCVAAIVVSGVLNGYRLTGTLAGLLGTLYGRLLVLKSLLLLGLLSLAWVHRYRLTPALDRARGSATVQQFRRSILAETLLGLSVLAVAGLLASSAPAVHEQAMWPLSVRFSREVLDDPDLGPGLLRAVSAAGLAGALLLLAVFRTRMRWPAVLLAVLLGLFAQPQLPLLLAPAYPTSFMNSPTGNAATSIVAGRDLFASHCTSCHGADGRGDGPQAKSLAVAPADLTAEHLWDHSDGDLFWWIGHGIVESGVPAMPGFEALVAPEGRWALIDYIHAHNAGLMPGAEWQRPIAAPDLDLSCASADVSGLGDLRGSIVLLALQPDSATADALAADRTSLTAAGIVPVLVQSGGPTPAGLCAAVGLAGVAAYAEVAGLAPEAAAGTQFLLDGDGWLRLRRRPGREEGWRDLASLVAAAQTIRLTPLKAPAGMGAMKMP